MKRIALFFVLVLLVVPLFSVNAQTATPAPTATGPVGGDGRSVQFSVEETPVDGEASTFGSYVKGGLVGTTVEVPVVADNDTTTMIILVVLSVLGWVIFGFVLRPAIIDAGRNLPPSAVEIFIAPINAALKLAQEASVRTPGKLDDVAVEELKTIIERIVSEIAIKPSPDEPTNP